MKNATRPGAGRRAPTIWLHVGTNKTGTTALQNALAGHRDLLLQHGLLYPRSAVHANAHHPIAWQCGFHQGPPPPSALDAAGLAASLKAEIAEHPGATVLLSSEFLSLPGDIRQLKQLLKPAHFRVIVYLRRHDAWLQSVYMQAVKSVLEPRWGRGMQAWLKLSATGRRPMGQYRELVDDWAKYVDPSDIVVRPFERSQIGDAPHLDLLRAIGFPSAAAAMPGVLKRENESMSWEALTLIDVLTHSRLPVELRGWMRDVILQADPGHQRGMSLLSPAERLAQIRANEADYAHIARTYLHRADGVLFRDPLPDPSQKWEPPSGPGYIWMVERLAGYLAMAPQKVLEPVRGMAAELISGIGPEQG